MNQSDGTYRIVARGADAVNTDDVPCCATVIFHGGRGRGAAGGAKWLVKDWIAWRDKSFP